MKKFEVKLVIEYEGYSVHDHITTNISEVEARNEQSAINKAVKTLKKAHDPYLERGYIKRSFAREIK